MTQFEIIMQTDKPELPARIENFNECKAAITAALAQYNTDICITEDTVKDAEKTRAHLRKVKSQIEDYRKDAKAQYLAKFTVLESQCKELSALIDEPITAIDAKIKAYENGGIDEKRKALEEYLMSIEHPAYITLERIINPKWKNKGATVEALKKELKDKVEQLANDYRTIVENFNSRPFWIAIDAKWQETLSLSQTLIYAAYLERKDGDEEKRAKAIQAAQQARTAQEQAQVVNIPVNAQNAADGRTEQQNAHIISGAFRCSGTVEQIKGLAAYMKQNGICYEVIK